MDYFVTPSERAQSLVNPHAALGIADRQERDRVGLGLKLIFGSPLRLFLLLYSISLAVSGGAIACSASALSLFMLGYMLVDAVSHPHELKLFVDTVDVPMLVFVFAALASTISTSAHPIYELSFIAWIPVYYFLTYALFLFPGINRLFLGFFEIVPLMAAFVLWQKYFGLHVDLASLPTSLARPISGIATVGFFNSPASYALTCICYICFACASLIVSTDRPRNFFALLLLGVGVSWVSLLTIHSGAILLACLTAVSVILFYCRRSFFFVFLFILAVFHFLAPPALEKAFPVWLEKGPQVSAQKRDIARAEFAMFLEHPWLGVGIGQARALRLQYFTKLHLKHFDPKLSSNSYFELLSETGLLGFVCYSLISLLFLLKSHRLWLEIPHTHFWHRVFVMGCIGTQIAFHVLGLYQDLLGSVSSMLILVFFLAVISYLGESYKRGIIPDDYSL